MLFILPLAPLFSAAAGLNALFAHGARGGAGLGRVYGLWNVTSLANGVGGCCDPGRVSCVANLQGHSFRCSSQLKESAASGKFTLLPFPEGLPVLAPCHPPLPLTRLSLSTLQGVAATEEFTCFLSHPVQTATEEFTWLLFPAMFVACKLAQARVIDRHVANLEIQDRTLLAEDPTVFWEA
ncbi:unnamed protein product [Closterium sp. Naga37s-1]|nr:unnamed protein product [Closterium sp. Naga37s-1]